jgi:hypothetical protein
VQSPKPPSGRKTLADQLRELAMSAASVAMRGRRALILTQSPDLGTALRAIQLASEQMLDVCVGIEVGAIRVAEGPQEAEARPLFDAPAEAPAIEREPIREPVVAAEPHPVDAHLARVEKAAAEGTLAPKRPTRRRKGVDEVISESLPPGSNLASSPATGQAEDHRCPFCGGDDRLPNVGGIGVCHKTRSKATAGEIGRPPVTHHGRPEPPEPGLCLWFVYPLKGKRPTYARWATDQADATLRTAAAHPAGYQFRVEPDDGTIDLDGLLVQLSDTQEERARKSFDELIARRDRERASEAAAVPKLDLMLREALLHREGAPGRWNKRREQGCTDEDLRDAVNVEVPRRSHGTPSHSEERGGWYIRGFPDAAFFLGGWSKGKRADLKGAELLAAVRRVMEIPLPPAEAKPARKPKARPTASREANRP